MFHVEHSPFFVFHVKHFARFRVFYHVEPKAKCPTPFFCVESEKISGIFFMVIRRQLLERTTGNPVHSLTDMQKRFLNNILSGMPQTIAARTAGYAVPEVEATRMLQNPKITTALQYLHRKHEKASQMTRKKVMDGFLESIEMAKLQGESAVMVAGWREVGRMCGYYAAEKRVIDINITAKRAVDRLETLSDAELMEMIEKDEAALEGECTEVLEATQEAADAHYSEIGL